MKRLLSTTTALSMALSPLQAWPLMAQELSLSLTADGRIMDGDGNLLCTPLITDPCDVDTLMSELAAAEAAGGAEGKAAVIASLNQAAVGAEAQAAASGQEATDAAQAEADAAAKAAADAAQAEADAAAKAAADAAQADADAAAKAAADAAQADADAAAKAAADAAQADADAAAKAAADAAQADADAAAKAAADAAQAEADAAANADAATKAAADAAAQAEADAAAQAAADAAAAAAADVPAAEAPLEPISDESEAALAAAATAEAEARAAAAVLADAPPPAPVDAPVVSDSQFKILTDLLATPDVAGAAGVGAAAALLAGGAGNAPSEAVADGSGDQAAPAEVTETTVTDADTRSSFEEFAAAPTAVEGGKKSGLSDLEKVGLVVLGAVVVGSLLSGGREVVANTGDRVVVQDPDGGYQIYKDDDTLLRRPGAQVRTETYRDGSTRSIVTREDGSEVVTIRDATGRVLRRATYDQTGNEVILIDDTAPEEVIDVTTLPRPRVDRVTISTRDENASLKAALARTEVEQIGRSFSLRQIREIKEVRRLAATIDVENITFQSGSAVIRTTEARKLADLGRIMNNILDDSPDEVFLIEGHTDAVGSAVSNLTLSDRRAESLALALTEYFGIPPENLVVQGYGESDLRIDTQSDEQLNRRAAVRVVTPLLRTASR